jgi:hypothetical protein
LWGVSAAPLYEVEDVVGGVVGVCLHEAVAVIAQYAPGRETRLEGAVLQQLDRGGIRRFDHLQVIEQTLARVQQAELEFIPDSWAEDVGGRQSAIRVIAPTDRPDSSLAAQASGWELSAPGSRSSRLEPRRRHAGQRPPSK